MHYEIAAKIPADCSAEEICSFVALVEQGGEVAAGGLQQRVIAAANLAFLRSGRSLAGVAALKHPNDAYRTRVAAASGASLSQKSFPYELGWVFIADEARGKGYAQPLSQAALALAGDNGVFATSRTENIAMHCTLAKLGFVASGSTYPSQHGGHHLQLFTRVPPNNSFKPTPLRGAA
ncbi:GNAT family N-acetyltransferase [Luteimonas sp. A501]